MSDVRKNYSGRRSYSAYSNVVDVCAIFIWQKVVGDFNILPHGSRLLLQQFGCDSQKPEFARREKDSNVGIPARK